MDASSEDSCLTSAGKFIRKTSRENLQRTFLVGAVDSLISGSDETRSKCNKSPMVFSLKVFLVWLHLKCFKSLFRDSCCTSSDGSPLGRIVAEIISDR